MAQDNQRSIIPTPAEEAVKWNGKPVTPKRIIDAWTDGASDTMKPFHDEVRRARGIRRGTLVRKIAESWATENPEAAKAAPARLHQRRTLESDLKARVGAIEPNFIRNAIGDLETDITNAQAYEDYLNEWATSPFGVPYTTFIDKGVEDGGYLRVRLPAMADMEGRPDFFERLSARAYARLGAAAKGAYKQDGQKKRRAPYVKVDDNGDPVPAPKYAKMLVEPAEDAKLSPIKRADRAKARSDKATSDHDLAVQRYLLQRPASTAQVFGGLDVVPIFKRGSGREQAELAAAVTRQLVTVEEALENDYGWKGMSGRLLVPRGDSDTNTVGKNGCYYLYTMFLTSKDEDGIEHPLILYTLGGKGTTYLMGGVEPAGHDSVGFIDLYEEYGIEGSLWSWHWGLKTRDDEPAYRGRPYLSDLADLILAIEGEEMAIRATAQVVSFTGHVQVLEDALKGPDPQAVLDAALETGTKNLKAPVIPPAGKAVTSISKIVPFQQTQIGRDAWQILESDRAALAEATAVDQASSSPGSSGRAIMVGETLAKTAKKDIREDGREAFRRDGEDHTRILAAIEKTFQIRWPIQKVEEPPAEDVTERGRYSVAEFDPAWIGDGQFTRLKAEYPDEYDIAALDEEAALADRGYSHFGNVMQKKGITDPLREWQKVLEWDLRRSPEYKQKVAMGLALRRGDKTMVEILKGLQAKQKISEAGVPGASNGVPTSAGRMIGQAAPGQTGGPTAAQQSRGGQIAAGKQTATPNQQDAMAKMQIPGAA